VVTDGWDASNYPFAMGGSGNSGFRNEVDAEIATLFSLVTENVGWATSVLLHPDRETADRVIASDEDIDGHCVRLTAAVKDRLASVAGDAEALEDLVSILQIVPELERSADLAKNIARRSLEGLGGVITPRSRGLIQAMGEVTIEMWRATAEAFATRSRDAIFELGESDRDLDELCAGLVSEGLAQGEDPKIAVDLALIARFYERLGDHAVNLARRVETMAGPRRTAAVTRKGRPRPRRSSDQTASATGLGRVRARLQRMRLMPHDNRLFELLEAAATNACDCADQLNKLISSFSDVEGQFEQIKGYERRGDELTVEILRLVDASFVTPFDREDIHALIEEIDDVVDDMFSAASLIQLFHVDRPLSDVSELAELLVAMAHEQEALIRCLRRRDGARFHLERIEQLERQGDAVFRRAMGLLFGGGYEALEVLKWKDILQALEDSLNAIEQVSDVVESILIKDS
jgi:uncharacterized protein Yka (UPF0111/DUF47 family)